MLRAVQPALSTRGEQRPCPPRTLARDLSRTLPGRPAHGVHPGPPEGSRAGGWAAASLAAAAGSGAGMASGKARWCGACVLHWNGAKPWVLANRSNGKLSASRADAQSEWLTAARSATHTHALSDSSSPWRPLLLASLLDHFDPSLLHTPLFFSTLSIASLILPSVD